MNPVRVGFEATGNCHRLFAHFLMMEVYKLELVPSLAVVRTLEAMHNLQVLYNKSETRDFEQNR